MKVVSFFKTLIAKAKELGEARQSRDIERIEKAEKEHEAYKQIVLKSDTMIV